MKNEPLVSICCLAYNHRPFIEGCLEGFLMQQTTFQIEILIHDDCSTDGTDQIIREYEARFPEFIFPLFEEENQYSRGNVVTMDFFNYRRARGKYIAICEGDDYWTDPLKLQKQVDFMEANPEYSVCFHTFRNRLVKTNQFLETEPTILLREKDALDGLDIDVNTFFQRWCTQPMTEMFRMSAFSYDWRNKYNYYRDMHEIFHLIGNGKCRLMNFDGGVRNVHEGGMSSMISPKVYCDRSLPVDRELFQNNPKVSGIRTMYACTLQQCVVVYSTLSKLGSYKFCIMLFFVNKSIKRLLKNLLLVFKAKHNKGDE